MSDLMVYRSWSLCCGRCANEATSYVYTREEAIREFDLLGWVYRGECTYCPECNKAVR